MVKFYIACFVIPLGLALNSCSKKDDPAPDEGGKLRPRGERVAQDLYGKTLDQVLEIKYSKADIVCDLWTQRTTALNLLLPPNDSVRIDLKKSPSLPFIANLNAVIENHQISAKLSFNSTSYLGLLQTTDSSGNYVIAKYSPVAETEVEYSMTTNFSSGASSSGSAKVSRRVFERIKDVIIDSSEYIGLNNEFGDTSNQLSVRDYLHCFVDTEMYPEYQDQFEVRNK